MYVLIARCFFLNSQFVFIEKRQVDLNGGAGLSLSGVLTLAAFLLNN